MLLFEFLIIGVICLPLGCQPQNLVSNKLLRASLGNGTLSIDGGQLQYSQTGGVSVAIYQCNPGYTLSGNVYRVCLNDGNWTGSIPQCDQIPSKYYIYYNVLHCLYCMCGCCNVLPSITMIAYLAL